MHNFLHILVRILAGLGGALLLYVAFFLYEDEENRIQNRLEQIWKRIDSLQKTAASKELAFLQGAATGTSTIFDRLLGPKLVSLQSLAVSMAVSLISLFAWASMFYSGMIFVFDRKSLVFVPCRVINPNLLAFGASILCILIFSSAPKYREREQRQWYYWMLAGVVISLPFVALILGATLSGCLVDIKKAERIIWSFSLQAELLVMLGIWIDVVFIAVFRALLRRLGDVTSIWTMVACLVLGSIAVTLLVAPALLISIDRLSDAVFPYGVHPSALGEYPVGKQMSVIVCYVCTTNFVDAACFLTLIAVMLLLLGHRLLWPLVKRPIYAVNRKGIIRNTKLLGTCGVMLLLYAFPSNPIAKWVADFLPKVKGG